MLDMNPLRVEFGPGGKYEWLGRLFARMLRPRSDTGRYLLAIVACVGLFLVFTAVAAMTGLLESRSASRVMTPVFIIVVVLTWRSIVGGGTKTNGPAAPMVQTTKGQAQSPITPSNTPLEEQLAVRDAYCPNCAASLSRVAVQCKRCGAEFSGEDAWKPVLRRPEIQEVKQLNLDSLYSVGRVSTLAGHIALFWFALAVVTHEPTERALDRLVAVIALYALGAVLWGLRKLGGARGERSQ